MAQEKKYEPGYRAWRYKDGKGEIFVGDEISKKEEEGWTDHPDKKADPKDDDADKKGSAGFGAVTKETKSP